MLWNMSNVYVNYTANSVWFGTCPHCIHAGVYVAFIVNRVCSLEHIHSLII